MVGVNLLLISCIYTLLTIYLFRTCYLISFNHLTLNYNFLAIRFLNIHIILFFNLFFSIFILAGSVTPTLNIDTSQQLCTLTSPSSHLSDSENIHQNLSPKKLVSRFWLLNCFYSIFKYFICCIMIIVYC